MDPFTVALQMHQDNYACFVGQACSLMDLGPTHPFSNSEDKRNTLQSSSSLYTQVSSPNKGQRRERYMPRCCPDMLHGMGLDWGFGKQHYDTKFHNENLRKGLGPNLFRWPTPRKQLHSDGRMNG